VIVELAGETAITVLDDVIIQWDELLSRLPQANIHARHDAHKDHVFLSGHDWLSPVIKPLKSSRAHHVSHGDLICCYRRRLKHRVEPLYQFAHQLHLD
jgi:hypothetical protein